MNGCFQSNICYTLVISNCSLDKDAGHLIFCAAIFDFSLKNKRHIQLKNSLRFTKPIQRSYCSRPTYLLVHFLGDKKLTQCDSRMWFSCMFSWLWDNYFSAFESLITSQMASTKSAAPGNLDSLWSQTTTNKPRGAEATCPHDRHCSKSEAGSVNPKTPVHHSTKRRAEHLSPNP